MRRIFVAVAAAASALALVAIVSASGSAQSAATPRTITFIDTSTGDVDSKAEHHAGGTSGFRGRLRSTDGVVTGHDFGVCTLVNLKRRESLCSIQMLLNNGQLSFQGVQNETSRKFVFVVSGGTGAYKGADGEAHVFPINDTKTRIEVELTS